MKFASGLLLLCSFISFSIGKAAPQHSPRQSAQVIYSCAQPNMAAITFDDGAYDYINDIVDLLDAKKAKATFFFNGDNYRCLYADESKARVKYAYDHGHQIASHTWTHTDLATLSWDQIHDEMWKLEQALQRIIGVSPAFMRPPYGSYNDQVLQVSYARGQNVVIWDFDSGDSTGSTVNESKAAYDKLVSDRPPNVLALNHETHASTAYEVLPYAIDKLQSAGYTLVTVAQCMGMDPYQSIGQPESGSWTC